MTERKAGFPFRSLGEWISFLEEKGQLQRNRRQMNLRNDFGLVSKAIAEKNGPAIVHENVWGYPGWHIHSEGLTTIQRRAWALGVP
ncbi:MAG: UbiD family decarboxylase, partial [Chloroflexi bacterium]|nr:UbiD family decarboxylase [Chloroflexota bacterium]